jgi:hypothetical protein
MLLGPLSIPENKYSLQINNVKINMNEEYNISFNIHTIQFNFIKINKNINIKNIKNLQIYTNNIILFNIPFSLLLYLSPDKKLYDDYYYIEINNDLL